MEVIDLRHLFLICILLLSACQQFPETSEQEMNLKDKLIEVTQLDGDKPLEKEDIDNALNEAASLGLQNEERDWFVRSYLMDVSDDKEIAHAQQALEVSQLRMLFEQTWRELALDKYGVEPDEQRVQELIELTFIPIEGAKNSPEQKEELEMLFYLANALGYRMDEFYQTFDRHIYERWAIAEKLYPILEEEYKLTDNQKISDKYRMEVIDEILKNRS